MSLAASWFASCWRLLLLTAVVGALIAGARLPAGRGLDTPAGEVSEARARQHLNAIACTPHATGTRENEQVREYIVAVLQSLGIETLEQSGSVRGVELTNVLAKIPGRDSNRTLMFACHYDSVTRSDYSRAPGAGDDGAAVASFLETARALLAAGPPKNDVWLLFTDGEELGLLGAKLFCRDPELLEPLSIAFNFEGIGNRGPSVMFQTGRDNAALIAEFAKLPVRKVAPSFAPAIYERMPNDTDFTVFSRHGISGLNFAIVGGRSAYHHAWDTPENLTPGTLQFQLDTVHALAQHFGESSREFEVPSGRRVFFDLPGGHFVHFPVWGNGILLALSLVLAVVALRGVRETGDSMAAALMGAVGQGVLAAALVGAGVYWIPSLAASLGGTLGLEFNPRGDALSATLVAWGAAALMVAGSLSWWSHHSQGESGGSSVLAHSRLQFGGLLFWSLASVATWRLLPLGHYLASLPLALAALAAPRHLAGVRAGRAAAIPALLSLGSLVLWLPSLGLLIRLMSHAPVVVTIVLALAAGLGLPLMAPCLVWIRAENRSARRLAWSLALTLLVSAGFAREMGL